MFYVDSSALLKLVLPESESVALYRWARQQKNLHVASSVIAWTEVLLAANKVSPLFAHKAKKVLDTVTPLTYDIELAESASRLSALRALDAIHVASALKMGSLCESLITYDQRMIEVATSYGLTVISPGVSQ